MHLHLESIQIGSPKPTPAGSLDTTAIDKQPVDEATIDSAGLQGDTIVDKKNHGGPDQAVYIYTRDDYAHWEPLLDQQLAGGAFGENLTIAGISSADVAIGDRFAIGSDVVLEAASARIPCSVFQHHLDEPKWIARFRDERRPGIYCRVIEGGVVRPGDDVVHHPGHSGVTILDTQDLYYDPKATDDRLRAALDAPVSIRVRALLESRLARRS